MRVLGKLSKEITSAVKMGGSDPTSNTRLENCILRARAANMQKTKIDNAIAAGSGLDAKQMVEGFHEAYFAGAGILAVTLTDNNLRALAEVRSTFKDRGARNADTRSHLFQMKAQLEFDVKDEDEDRITEVALTCPLEDFHFGESRAQILSDVSAYKEVRQAIEKAGFPLAVVNYPYIPSSQASISSENYAALEELLEALEDLETVQNVYHNAVLAD